MANLPTVENGMSGLDVRTIINANDQSNAAAIATETTRATAAEQELSTDLAAETARATAAEQELSTDLAAETTRAEGVEQGIGNRLDAAETAHNDLSNTVDTLSQDAERVANKKPLSSTAGANDYPSSKSVWSAIEDVVATIPAGGLKVPVTVALESILPDVSTLEAGDYFFVQNMDVSAPDRTGRAWVNYIDPADTSSALAYYKVYDQYQSMDQVSITQTGSGAWEVNLDWLNSQIPSIATSTKAGLTLSDAINGEFVVDPATGAVSLAEQTSSPTTIIEDVSKFTGGTRKTLKAWMGDLFGKVNGLFTSLAAETTRATAAEGALTSSKQDKLSTLASAYELQPTDLITITPGYNEDSLNIEVENFKAAMGLDYSSLDEQAIPGRRLMGVDGVARQAYVRTFVGRTHPDAGGGYYPIGTGTPISYFTLLSGVVLSSDGILTQPQMATYGANMNKYWDVGTVSDDAGKNIIAIFSRGGLITNRPYSITVMYTKR